ncbi:hypothetical protein Lwal_0883 [Legionella waltersii]|uniref:Uncharacterized protein n=1 Tax=Legionella waltersii TaxID=66969 RepID=A0A0W1AM72_9GAMM|nr:hypothetical protein Lwal_0883 [Legionella waltersii]
MVFCIGNTNQGLTTIVRFVSCNAILNQNSFVEIVRLNLDLFTQSIESDNHIESSFE